jgi:glycerophosphoryl diester phosphodiesterase
LAAFAAARDAGVGVELDVHVTADGVPVVLHDQDLERVAGVRLDVRRVPLDAVQEHRLRDGSPVPTLVAALDVLGDAPVMVEVKNLDRGAGRIEPPVAAVLDEHARRAYVASFHPGTLRWFRQHRPTVLRAQTASGTFDAQVPAVIGRGLSWLLLNGRSLPHLLSYDVRGLRHPAVRHWRARGGVVVAWTVRSGADLARAAGLADNVIFEHIDPPTWPRSTGTTAP